MSDDDVLSGTEPTAVLIINPWESLCGRCGVPVLLSATHHTDESGVGPPEGCGARFTETGTEYANITIERLRQLRPDLPVVGGGVV
ncbi:hypothetical protein ACFC58_41420 [Kitasatospora purpeofusca]|uniref:hypothetical protein n=1 Tax=Kitasatospora purpeofusca TaxID=67352 RepID=UPI0035E3462D